MFALAQAIGGQGNAWAPTQVHAAMECNKTQLAQRFDYRQNYWKTVHEKGEEVIPKEYAGQARERTQMPKEVLEITEEDE